ncbi:FecR family protein [Fuchsiella alkaliacetigena]|nr:FecR family protein [Fuchsiella alkaliacetigena]
MFLIILLVLACSTMNTYAANEIAVSTDKTELQPQEEVEVFIELLTEDGETFKEDTTLSVDISAGSIAEPEILDEGLNIEAGQGSFTYIAPEDSEDIDIYISDPKTELSAQHSLEVIAKEIVEEQIADQIVVSTKKTEIQASEEVEVFIELLTENGETFKEDTTLSVDISAGSIAEPEILDEGLNIEAGQGSFTYIASEDSEDVDISISDPKTELSAQHSLEVIAKEIVEEQIADQIVVSTKKTEIQASEEVEVFIELLTEDGETFKEDTTLSVDISAGSIAEPEILDKGLNIEAGQGSFTYIASEDVENVDISITDPETEVSAQHSLEVIAKEIVEEQIADQIIVSTEETEIQASEEVEVFIEILDENKNIFKEDSNIFIRLSKGKVAKPEILTEGLTIEEGQGSFTYTAPDEAGEVSILIIDSETNLSTRHSLEIIEEAAIEDWQEELAIISSVQGNAALKSPEKETWSAITADTEVSEGTIIKTWDNSWVTLELFDGSELIIEPLSTVSIEALKSSTEKPDTKRSAFKVLAGNVLAEARGYIEQGARFEIESQSTAAGVRGTFFEYTSSLDGKDEVTVYEGSVNFEYPEQNFSTAVAEGERVSVSTIDFVTPSIIEHDITPEMRRETLAKEQEAAREKEVEEIDEEEIEEEEVVDEDRERLGRFTPSQANLSFGSRLFDDDLYLGFGLQPEFEEFLSPNLSFGLDLILYQDPIREGLTLTPGQEDVRLTNPFNWIEYDGDYAYLNYGDLENISYGYGLLFGNYSKDNAKGIQVGANDISKYDLDFRFLIPMDIRSIYPWYTESTSTLYSARVSSDFKAKNIPFEAGVTTVADFNSELEELEVPQWGLAADISIPMVSLAEPYLEVSTLDGLGSGSEIGVRGDFWDRFWHQSGIRFVGQGFIPNYFGNDYEDSKENSLAEDSTISASRKLPTNAREDYPSTVGAYSKLGINFNMLSFELGYEVYKSNREEAPILTSNLNVDTSQLLILPKISAGFKYRQPNFNQEADNLLFNENTRFSWYLAYPLQAGSYITLNNTYTPEKETSFTREIGFQMRF